MNAFKKAVRAAYPQHSPPKVEELFLLSTDSLKHAIVALARHRVHRLCVVKSSEERVVEGVVTMSDVLHYLLAVATGEATSGSHSLSICDLPLFAQRLISGLPLCTG